MDPAIDFDDLPKKQQQLISTATELYCRYGIRRVTVEEICKEATISKMTFYKYFRNKWDIARTTIFILINDGIKIYYQMVEEDIPFVEKVERLLVLTTAQVHAFGSDLIDELMDEACPLHDFFLEQQTRARNLSLDFFSRAQQQGHISPDTQLPFLLFLLDRTTELVNHPDFIKIMPEIEDRANEMATLFIHGFARPSIQQ